MLFLWSGARWARWVGIVMFGVSALAGLRMVPELDGGMLAIIVHATVISSLFAFLALTFSPHVRAYFADPALTRG